MVRSAALQAALAMVGVEGEDAGSVEKVEAWCVPEPGDGYVGNGTLDGAWIAPRLSINTAVPIWTYTP